MRGRAARKLIVHATEGVFSTLTDVVLSEIFFFLLMTGARSSYDVYRASEEARRLIDERINYTTIKQTLYNLTRKGLIKRSPKRSAVELEITDLGKKRINALFPTYHENRPWDGYMYLISYDIPVKTNEKRALLREYLRRIGCALLQESFWITPYAPQHIIKEYTEEHNIPGTVLVSKLGKDGTIGDESFEDLIRRVYHLDDLANRYTSFIDAYEGNTKTSLFELSLAYFAILKDDPQLPFELLPKHFPAARAWNLFRAHFP